MSVADLCDVCEERPAKHQCPNCGQSVCDLHYDEERNLCPSCIDSLSGADDISPGERSELDETPPEDSSDRSWMK